MIAEVGASDETTCTTYNAVEQVKDVTRDLALRGGTSGN
jgi:hypothetical protein